jgi:hypothetical protein
MINGELLPLTLIDANQSSIMRGTIICIDRTAEQVDVEIDSVTYTGIGVHYHCQGGDKAQGYKAFKIGDIVLIKNSKPNSSIDPDNLIVVGFADGFPKMCTRRLALFSVSDGNPSYLFSGDNNVLWDIDEEEIVIGPCSFMDLQAEGYIETLSPSIIVRGYGIPATSFVFENDQYLTRYSADANIAMFPIPSQGDLEALIFKEENPPNYNNSNSLSVGPYEVTERTCYADGSQRIVSSEESSTREWSYTTTEVEDHWVGYDDPPYYFVGEYTFETSHEGYNESVQGLANLYYDDYLQPDTAKEIAGLFYTTNNDFTDTINCTGDTAWASTGTIFEFTYDSRYRETTIKFSNTETKKYYSPIANLCSINLMSQTDRVTTIDGAQSPVVESERIYAETDHVECEVYSAITTPELIAEDGSHFYEQISIIVYTAVGDITTTINGSTSAVVPVAGVNVSIDVYKMDDYNDYFAFESENITDLADAIKSAILNSDGGKTVSITLFRGSIL